MKPDTVKYLKLAQSTLKIATILGVLAMTIHCILLLSGIHSNISEYFFGFGFICFGFFLILSKAMQLCNCFRIALCYLWIVQNCIYLQREYLFFGNYLQQTRFIVAISGISILFNILGKHFKQNCDDGQ